MRVDKWEFAWEFSQLSCPSQTRTRVAWELRSESLYESFLNSRAPVKREQELHESWWELRSESLYESFLNSHAPVKQKQEQHESWLDITARVAKTLINVHQNLNQFKVNDFINKVSLVYHYGTKFNNISVELRYRQRVRASIIDPKNYCKTSYSTRLYWERSLWRGISWQMARWRCRYKNIFHKRWMLLAQRNRNVPDSHVKTWTYLRLVHSTCSPFNLFIQFYPSLHYYKVSFGTLH